MKIAFITKDLSLDTGMGRYSYHVVKSVERLGNETVVFEEFSLKRGILRELLRIRRETKDCEIIHALDIWPYAIPAYLAVLGRRKKLFMSGVGTYSVKPLDNFWKKVFLRVVFWRTNEIFAISSYVMDEIRKRTGFQRIRVVHMGISPIPKLSREDFQKYDNKYQIDLSKRPILLTVGGIKHRKGQFDTMLAVEKLLSTYPNLQYLIVGDTSESKYTEKIIEYAKKNGFSQNIRIINDAKGDEALSFFYETCDVFVMNSNNEQGHFEGFGLVFLEAGSFGKPVVGSRGCGIADAIGDGYNGYLSEQSNPRDIAEKIDAAYKRKDELGQHSLIFVHRFSWDKTGEEYVESYKR